MQSYAVVSTCSNWPPLLWTCIRLSLLRSRRLLLRWKGGFAYVARKAYRLVRADRSTASCVVCRILYLGDYSFGWVCFFFRAHEVVLLHFTQRLLASSARGRALILNTAKSVEMLPSLSTNLLLKLLQPLCKASCLRELVFVDDDHSATACTAFVGAHFLSAGNDTVFSWTMRLTRRVGGIKRLRAPAVATGGPRVLARVGLRRTWLGRVFLTLPLLLKDPRGKEAL